MLAKNDGHFLNSVPKLVCIVFSTVYYQLVDKNVLLVMHVEKSSVHEIFLPSNLTN